MAARASAHANTRKRAATSFLDASAGRTAASARARPAPRQARQDSRCATRARAPRALPPGLAPELGFARSDTSAAAHRRRRGL
jgi:hypothetical protein